MHLPDGTYLRVLHRHRHSWAGHLTRRQFLGATAAVGGAAATASLWTPLLAEASSSVDASPIPETLFGSTPFHVLLPGTGEPGTITDFNGVLGLAAVSGTGTGTNTHTGAATRLVFDADLRFMQGQYVGAKGQTHEGTFVFV